MNWKVYSKEEINKLKHCSKLTSVKVHISPLGTYLAIKYFGGLMTVVYVDDEGNIKTEGGHNVILKQGGVLDAVTKPSQTEADPLIANRPLRSRS
jgi:hypothetical protein